MQRDEIRGGTRGGRSQFSWDDVKQDKQREHYLGSSVMAPTGRYHGSKDLSWFNRPSTTTTAGLDKKNDKKKKELNREVDEVNKREREIMELALGVEPIVKVENERVVVDDVREHRREPRRRSPRNRKPYNRE